LFSILLSPIDPRKRFLADYFADYFRPIIFRWRLHRCFSGAKTTPAE
jgi:hypothetical protein